MPDAALEPRGIQPRKTGGTRNQTLAAILRRFNDCYPVRNRPDLDPFCGSGTTLVEALHRCR
jgi:23S rRNA G2445 N2-methylase RlmL